MKKILFILKDDDIYDAWVQKAKELQFISLDDSNAVTTNISKQSTSNTGKTTEKPNRNDQSNAIKQTTEMRVIDVSTSDSTGKPVDPDHENSPGNLSPNPNKKSGSEEPTENEEDNNETNTDKKTEKTTRYVTSTAEPIVFIIFPIKSFMNGKNVQYLQIF
jgi:hypothetical protein